MKDIVLTDRMKCVASMVTEGNMVADIGCDHAYVSIYLMQQSIAKKVIAMDVRKGPLEIALKNVNKYGFNHEIETRLSDGLAKLKEKEVDTIIIAGMGGILISDILDVGKHILEQGVELILQPQSDIHIVREKLHELGYSIVLEDMLIDMDKYYTVIKANKLNKDNGSDISYDKLIFYKYGKYLLDNKSDILHKYLLKEQDAYNRVLSSLNNNTSSKAMDRYREIEEELKYIKEALCLYDM